MIDLCKYMTKHSISGGARDYLVEKARELDPFNTFMDFGCHFGHVSIHFAIEFPVAVFAVDNFTGTKGDKLMEDTINELTGGRGNFLVNFINNVKEASLLCGGFKGIIIPVPIDCFKIVCKDIIVDLAFIDASHLSEDAYHFKEVSDLIKVGGLLAYHDAGTPGVDEGCDLIKDDYTLIGGIPLTTLKKVK